MAFQFVHATPGDIEYSAETRRRIRSQAMRDYRRRQRAEASDDDSTTEPSPPSSSASPPITSPRQSRQTSHRRQSRSQSLRVQSVNLRRNSSGTSSDNPTLAESIEIARGKRPSPQTPLEGQPAPTSQRRRRTADEPRAQHGVFSQFMINLPKRTTPPRMNEDVDLSGSRSQCEQMLEACESYSTWLNTSGCFDQSTPNSSTSYDDKTKQMLLCALSLKSIGHIEAIQPGRSKIDKDIVKAKVLALLNTRLKDPSKALEDSTIGALACLASYEISQASTEATMHLTGLQQIISLRGGTRRVGETAGLGMFLEMLDLTHAVYYHTIPMYTVADPSHPSSTEQTPAPSFEPDNEAQLERQTLDDLSNFILSIPELAETGSQLPETAAYSNTPPRRTLDEEVEHWDRFLRQSARSVGEQGSDQLAHACRIAADVHLMTTSAVQAHPMRVRMQVDELYKAMAVVGDDTWDDLSVLHTRILLTALSTASHVQGGATAGNGYAFYHAHLTRRLYQTELEDWPQVKSLLLRFLEMQKGAARRLREGQWGVRELSRGLDMEIVVSSAETAGQRGR